MSSHTGKTGTRLIDLIQEMAYNDSEKTDVNGRGGMSMATSSIFTNVKITDTGKAEAFIDAMAEAADSPRKEFDEAETRFLINDIATIRAMMAKKLKQ